MKDILESEIAPALGPKLKTYTRREVQFVGTSGTTSILARIELGLARFRSGSDRGNASEPRPGQISAQASLETAAGGAQGDRGSARRPRRRDLTGVAIYEAIMERFGFADLRVSTRGLRFAAVMEGR